ncbi:hypothetical protein [Neobacillus sp.]|uniref:hypothetical protein n=1 Tax=Neobacillus sp. TaxID=2675273 RepID=UPI00289E3818|nr:hypothetical protein [Neobacillus sp.]
MVKSYSKIVLVLLLSFSLIGLSGCFGKEKESNAAEKKAVASTQSTDKATEKNQSTDQKKKTTQSTDQTNKASQNTNQADHTSQSTSKEKKTTQSTDKGNKTSQTNKKIDKAPQSTNSGKTTQNTEQANPNPSKDQTVGDKEVTDFVLNNTRMVQISSISKRTNEKHPDLGPFFVVRGIDLRGEVSEVWIKDMKIFEMVTQTNN